MIHIFLGSNYLKFVFGILKIYWRTVIEEMVKMFQLKAAKLYGKEADKEVNFSIISQAEINIIIFIFKLLNH